jgi:hypothetical protein
MEEISGKPKPRLVRLVFLDTFQRWMILRNVELDCERDIVLQRKAFIEGWYSPDRVIWNHYFVWQSHGIRWNLSAISRSANFVLILFAVRMSWFPFDLWNHKKKLCAKWKVISAHVDHVSMLERRSVSSDDSETKQIIFYGSLIETRDTCRWRLRVHCLAWAAPSRAFFNERDSLFHWKNATVGCFGYLSPPREDLFSLWSLNLMWFHVHRCPNGRALSTAFYEQCCDPFCFLCRSGSR